MDGIAVLELADVRDSIVRLGGQVPTPTSDVGRPSARRAPAFCARSTFNADPYFSPEKPSSSESPEPSLPLPPPPDPKSCAPGRRQSRLPPQNLSRRRQKTKAARSQSPQTSAWHVNLPALQDFGVKFSDPAIAVVS